MATKHQTPLEKALRKLERQGKRMDEMVTEYTNLSNTHDLMQTKANNLNNQLIANKSENATLRSDNRTLRESIKDNNKVFDIMRTERETLLRVMNKLVS